MYYEKIKKLVDTLKKENRQSDVKFILNCVGTVISGASSYIYIREIEDKLNNKAISNTNELNVLENKTAYLKFVDTVKTSLTMVNEIAKENESEIIFKDFEQMDCNTISTQIILPLTKEYLERLI